MVEQIRSAQLLVRNALADTKTVDDLRANPTETLKRLEKEALSQLPPPVFTGDKAIYRMVVGSLGIVVIMAVAGAIGLTLMHSGEGEAKIPDLLTALGSAAIGALAGLLAPSPTQRG